MRQSKSDVAIKLSESEREKLPLGLPALFEELAAQGIGADILLRKAGLWRGNIERSVSDSSVERRLRLFRAIVSLSKIPETALHAGRRQQIKNFGAYGFALATSRTMKEAIAFGLEHIDLAGSVVPIEFENRGEVGIFRSINPSALGDVLPFAAEFWRSSISTLLSDVLGRPFPTLGMYFTYPPPPHSEAYLATFDCPVQFNSDYMEWHFDAAVLDEPCLNPDKITARLCQTFCERILTGHDDQTSLQRQIKSLCLGRPASQMSAHDVAKSLGMSLRTLHRRLHEQGVTFQTLLDETRKSIAREFLLYTNLSVAEIGFRCGYSDVSNFRKAFKKWTGQSASSVRAGVE